MSDTPKKRKYKKKKKTGQEEEISEKKILKTTEFATVSELANLIDVDPGEIISVCMSLGILVTINQRLDRDTILMVADEFGYDVDFETEYGEDKVELLEEEEEEVEDAEHLEERPPVVTIMGHVDHGKTSLLDHIRQSNVTTGESGGITQHIGAYEINYKKRKIVFLDTPGHEAFTAMRARGAKVTDIVVLLIAADDGVMPQTVEAINHARAAGESGVPIIVAINKIDRPDANPGEVRKQLSEHNILVEEWGGKVQDAEISAKTGQGVDHLLEKILLEAEMLELKANPKVKPKGVIIEAEMIKGKGVVSTVLINKGTLKVGDIFVAGQYNGRVRALYDENNKKVKKAWPSKPVQVIGFTGVPQAGDSFVVVDSEQEAKRICNKRQQLRREQNFRQIRRTTLDQISKEISEGKLRELSLLIKGDVDGSVEAIADSLMALSTDEVGVKIVHKGVGAIVESDVLLAETSNAVIIGFNVTINDKARELSREENVDIRRYEVIYDIVNDVKLALSGLLEPERNEENIGSAEIRKIYKSSKTGLIAGCYMLDGKAKRGSLVRLIRDQDVIYEGKVDSLKRFNDDVKEVDSGYECGIVLDNCDDIQEGDTMEFYKIVEKARTL
ncbi:MAG: translation initiation factor IF-2 [bacterium]